MVMDSLNDILFKIEMKICCRFQTLREPFNAISYWGELTEYTSEGGFNVYLKKNGNITEEAEMLAELRYHIWT